MGQRFTQIKTITFTDNPSNEISEALRFFFLYLLIVIPQYPTIVGRALWVDTKSPQQYLESVFLQNSPSVHYEVGIVAGRARPGKSRAGPGRARPGPGPVTLFWPGGLARNWPGACSWLARWISSEKIKMPTLLL